MVYLPLFISFMHIFLKTLNFPYFMHIAKLFGPALLRRKLPNLDMVLNFLGKKDGGSKTRSQTAFWGSQTN